MKDKRPFHLSLTPLALALAAVSPHVYGQAPDAPELAVEEVVVTGIRQSLSRAQDLKAESEAIIDAVVAEDIGKLPDRTAAESVARLAGVQVTRAGDEVTGVLVRGLPDVTTTYNGREIFTAELRRVQLQDFPAAALAGIDVYKSGTANIVEPGLAGLVNVRTRRPFDFDGQKVAGGVHGAYNDQNEEFNPSGNFLYSNRWATGAGEFGFLGNVSRTQYSFYNGVRFAGTHYVEAQPHWDIEQEQYSEGGFILPDIVGLHNDGGKRYRPSGNIALQWRPNDELEVYFDGIYQGYRGELFTDHINANLTGWHHEHGDPVLTDIVMVEGTDDTQVKSVVKNGGIPPEGFRSTRNDYTNTYHAALGVNWQRGRWELNTDLSYTKSRYNMDEWSLDFALNQPPEINADFNTGGGAAFGISGVDMLEQDNYRWRGYWERSFMTSGEGFEWRFDTRYHTDWPILQRLDMGFRITDRDATLEDGGRYAWTLDLATPLADLPVDIVSTTNPFRGDAQAFRSYLAPSRASVIRNRQALRDLSRAALDELDYEWQARDRERWANDPVAVDPNTAFLAEEQSYAAYLQGRYFFELGGVDFDGLLGVRVVQTEGTYAGVSAVTFEGETRYEPREREASYVDVLPNFSLRAKLTDKVQVRAGFTQTRTRPEFAALNPAMRIDQVVSTGPENPNAPESEIDAFGSAGNPDLEPLTSDNYDLSIEYYFSDSGYVSLAAFYRDLFGFTNHYTRRIEDPEYGTVQLSRPENAGEGSITGYELNVQTFLDFLPGAWSNIGVMANTTYMDGKNREPDGEGNFGEYVELIGLSEWTYNAAVFYEDGAFTTRLSYNYRSPWINWYGQTMEGGGFTGNKTRSRDRLALHFGYQVNKHINVYADVGNLLAEPFRNYVQIDETRHYEQDVRDEGRYFGVGMRFDF
ncbi:TonB-dependent receptor [Marinimicrobium alkaliphilum]|uniref:TonB-dependent receptor n=1 Tax=Marinimicrobium alkaliphilum TaxID=2202654 RepID=UPI000DB97E28|nr:TonB-dependent receptor [Marinimicrobium alkaliphilum]